MFRKFSLGKISIFSQQPIIQQNFEKKNLWKNFKKRKNILTMNFLAKNQKFRFFVRFSN